MVAALVRAQGARRRVLVSVRDAALRASLVAQLAERGLDAQADVDVDAAPCRAAGPGWDVVLVDLKLGRRDVALLHDRLSVDPRTQGVPVVAVDPSGPSGHLPELAATLHRVSSLDDLVRAIDAAAR